METKNRYDKGYWDMVRVSNDDKEYPANMGEKWSDSEEIQLLLELKNDIDIETISQNHKRTIGGIKSRCKEIAYRMYLKNVPIEEIIKKAQFRRLGKQRSGWS